MKMKTCVCLISTGKYWQFVQPLIDSIKEYFLLSHQIEIKLFTDDVERMYYGDERVSVNLYPIPSYKFPLVTLYRYKIMANMEYDCDYIFYMDVDMRIVEEVGDEILFPLVGVMHPGYAVVGGGAWCTNPNSLAYVPDGKIYIAGGFQGGDKYTYLKAVHHMAKNIEEDEKNGVMATWHDESHWNAYLVKNNVTMYLLPPSHCMVENTAQRQLWKIDKYIPRILALDKKHKEIRS